ncbi:MAG: hypothetical protein ABI134_30140, partial [Byssovorax sp.]
MSSSKRGWLGAALASMLVACGSGLPETEPSGSGAADASVADASVDPDAGVQVGNTPPQIPELPAQVLDEEQSLSLDVPVSDLDGDVPRVFVEGLPPGARFDEVAR